MKKTIFVLLAVSIIFSFCYSIDDMDGFYKALEEARYYTSVDKLDSADLTIKSMKDYLTDSKLGEDTDEYGNYYYIRGVREMYSDKDGKADEYFSKTISVFEKNYGKGSEIMFHVYRNIGKECVMAEKYDKAQVYFTDAEKAFAEAGLSEDLNYAELRFLMAQVSYNGKNPDYKKCIEYAIEAKDAYEEGFDFGDGFCRSLEMAGDSYKALKDNANAKLFYNDALSAYSEYYGEDDYKVEEILQKISDLEKK